MAAYLKGADHLQMYCQCCQVALSIALRDDGFAALLPAGYAVGFGQQ